MGFSALRGVFPENNHEMSVQEGPEKHGEGPTKKKSKTEQLDRVRSGFQKGPISRVIVDMHRLGGDRPGRSSVIMGAEKSNG